MFITLQQTEHTTGTCSQKLSVNFCIIIQLIELNVPHFYFLKISSRCV